MAFLTKYVTAVEVQAEGATATTAEIDRRIIKWEAIVERITRNIFKESSPGELIFDGSNSRILHFGIPLISVSSVLINDETVELETDEFRAFTGRMQPQDDRYNPKLVLTGNRKDSIFRQTTHAMFIQGLDQKITAVWGFVEDDPENAGQYLTPQPIKDSIIQLVILDLDGYFAQMAAGSGGIPLSAVRREKTDDHEVEYMGIEDVRIIYAMIPRSIYDVLMLYRAPISIASPDPRIFHHAIDTRFVFSV